MAAVKWEQFESRYVSLLYDDRLNLSQINEQIDIQENVLNHFKQDGILKKSVPAQLQGKLGTIFQRAKAIMNMHPPGVTVNIRIYSRAEDIKDEYKNLFNREYKNHRGKSEVLAFYIFKTNTIYILIDHLKTSVLAHEMGHCIINHFFIIPPPVETQEILAMYVDKHFSDI